MPGTKDETNVVFTGRGHTSKRDITVSIERKSSGHGIVFQLEDSSGQPVLVPARAQYVVNTLRNVTLGIDRTRLCIVEHLLCAASLWGLDDLLVKVDGPEVPLDDGSAKFWIQLFQQAGWPRSSISATRVLQKPVIIKKGDRQLMAIPDDSFSATYLLDWDHPAIGKCWGTWTPASPIEDIADARTFGSMQEHQLLGITEGAVSLTKDGFSHPLRYPDEPVRHKLLDLIGDLALVGVNPLSWKARFISIKGGHEMDVLLAKELSELV